MVLTPRVPGMLKLMVSAPEVALACSMAALSVQRPGSPNTNASHTLSVVSPSKSSAVELTVKVVVAWAGWAPSAKSAPASASAASTNDLVICRSPLLALIVVMFVMFWAPLCLQGGKRIARPRVTSVRISRVGLAHGVAEPDLPGKLYVAG